MPLRQIVLVLLVPSARMTSLAGARDSADVVAAAEEGKFRVIPMETIDQGFELLTGVPIKTTDRKIAARLDDFAAKAAALRSAREQVVAGGPVAVEGGLGDAGTVHHALDAEA